MIAPPLAQSYSRHMIAGARLEVLEGGNSHDVRAKFGAAPDRRFQSSKPIDGIITPLTTSAIVSVVSLERAGRRLGEDIDLVSKEPSPFVKTFRAPIMAIREEPMIAGRFLAEAVMRAIECPEMPPLRAMEMAREPESQDPHS
ncbi:hypothetical protein [Aliiruegeria lutimaris]|uniref:Substrate-binding protein-like domain-containing protein n=1 Tax=Aliiruegeria lutimaris TaxID=571298 RepID=A0A1G8V1W8_9RHOB|nr:hypothetical protein [Aliiruegeria lutimaris]SDJ60096.1 hypothetical protein SAMN04488026_102056 [Aliiruegeria lutimaris]